MGVVSALKAWEGIALHGVGFLNMPGDVAFGIAFGLGGHGTDGVGHCCVCNKNNNTSKYVQTGMVDRRKLLLSMFDCCRYSAATFGDGRMDSNGLVYQVRKWYEIGRYQIYPLCTKR